MTKNIKTVDAIIYAPLEAEYLGVQAEFSPSKATPVDGDSFTGYMTKINQRDVVVVTGFDFGNAESQAIWREVLEQFIPSVAICVGIAGGISKDARLGDVFFGSSVQDLTQRQKRQKVAGKVSTAYDPIAFNPDEDIHKCLQRWRLAIGEESNYRKWQKARAMVNDGRLASVDTTKLEKPGRPLTTPVASPGIIASTNAVIASSDAVDDIKKAGRKLSCVDNESAGFMRELKRHPTIKTLIVRGISDYSDETKGSLEEDHKDAFRKLAIENAVSFLRNNFDAVFDAVKQRGLPLDDSSGESVIERLEGSIQENAQKISNALHEKSLLHKIAETHDMLPTPRLRFDEVEGYEGESKFTTLEISEALSIHDRILADIPINYPDLALPWQYATAIDRVTINDRLAIPIIVDWSDFAAPSRTLLKLLELKNLGEVVNSKDFIIIFIFPNYKLGAPNKTEFLKTCLDDISNSSILVFSEDRQKVPYNNYFIELMNPEKAQVQGVSFAAVTRYMNNAMDMDYLEAEVSAKRLFSAFQGHKLPIHSSYIASISKDVLTRLINASQKGELVQITVVGLLTLLVAGDKSRIRISRTGREDFLLNLTVSIYADKNNYTEDELLVYVKELDKKMNFGISPRSFISAFLESGILHFKNDFVRFTIPIIKSYMLSKGLVLHPDKAEVYFDLHDSNFDFSTFDLYCEYSRRTPILEKVKIALDDSIEFFEVKISEYDEVVENGKFRPQLFKGGLNLVDMSKQLSADAQELAEKTSLVDEKQAILDVQDQIVKTKEAKDSTLADDEKFVREHSAVRQYSIAAMMLGTGAERLDSADKQYLIGRVLKLVDLMLTDILTLRLKFASTDAAKRVGAAFIKQHNIEFEGEADKNSFDDFISRVISNWEFERALSPVMFFLHVLCESGRSNILLAPLNDVEVNSVLEEFFRTSWMFDMDPIDEKRRPKELSKKLGSSTFLRIAFAIFFFNQSYWFHSDLEKKQGIADGVNELLSKIFKEQKIASNPEES